MYTAGDVKKSVYLGQGNVKIKWHILDLLQYTEITVYGKSLDFFPFCCTIISSQKQPRNEKQFKFPFTIYRMCGGQREIEKTQREKRGKMKVTNLWTLPHLLTFSYDVVSHDNKR